MMRALLAVLGTMLGLQLLGTPAAGQDPSPGEQLIVSEWSLIELDGRPVPDAPAIDVTFWPSGRVTGSGGCNRYESTWTAFGPDRLVLGPVSTSSRACRAAVVRREASYLDLLWRATQYSIVADRLTITAAPGSLVFRAGAQGPGVLFGRWRLVALDGDRVPEELEAAATFREGGSVAGSAGCNEFRGSYEVDDAAIAIGTLLATRITCDPELMRVEDAYLADLEAATSWSVRGDTLLLRARGGAHALELAAQRPVVFRALTDAGWRLVEFGATEVSAATGMTAIFTSSGTLTGSTGCNGFAGRYSVDGAVLLIDELATTTGRTCAPQVMSNEAAFLDALRAATGWKLPSNQLLIITASGTRLLFDGTAAEDGLPSATRTVVDAITGVVWTLDEAAGTPMGNLPPVTLVILADGSVSGVSGCDLYSATYEVEGETLRISDAAAGGRQCDEAVMALQQSYLLVLPLVDGVSLEGGQLVLTLAGTDQALRFSER